MILWPFTALFAVIRLICVYNRGQHAWRPRIPRAKPAQHAYSPTPQGSLTRRRPVSPQEAPNVRRKAYFPRYPAVDRLFDVIADNGLPNSSMNFTQSAGRMHLTVLLPGNRFTDEYEGADIQAVAQRWLNAETGEDNEGRTVILALAGYDKAAQAA
jgi:hypothetical protein